METNKSFTESSSDGHNMKLGDILGKENSKNNVQEESSSEFEADLFTFTEFKISGTLCNVISSNMTSPGKFLRL